MSHPASWRPSRCALPLPLLAYCPSLTPQSRNSASPRHLPFTSSPFRLISSPTILLISSPTQHLNTSSPLIFHLTTYHTRQLITSPPHSPLIISSAHHRTTPHSITTIPEYHLSSLKQIPHHLIPSSLHRLITSLPDRITTSPPIYLIISPPHHLTTLSPHRLITSPPHDLLIAHHVLHHHLTSSPLRHLTSPPLTFHLPIPHRLIPTSPHNPHHVIISPRLTAYPPHLPISPPSHHFITSSPPISTHHVFFLIMSHIVISPSSLTISLAPRGPNTSTPHHPLLRHHLITAPTHHPPAPNQVHITKNILMDQGGIDGRVPLILGESPAASLLSHLSPRPSTSISLTTYDAAGMKCCTGRHLGRQGAGEVVSNGAGVQEAGVRRVLRSSVLATLFSRLCISAHA
jgi:hypothetical protein